MFDLGLRLLAKFLLALFFLIRQEVYSIDLLSIEGTITHPCLGEKRGAGNI